MNGLGSAVRTKISLAVFPGSDLCRSISFYNFIDICLKFQLFLWHSGHDNRVLKRWVRFRIPAFIKIFNFIKTTESRDNPPSSYAWNFLIHKKIPLRNVLLWDKKLLTKIRDIRLLRIKFFKNRKFLKHWRFPLRIFMTLWEKQFQMKIVMES